MKMKKAGKHNTLKMICSGIAAAIGIVLLSSKEYSPVGLILLSFGSVVFGLSLEAKKKEITTDELTELVSGKAAMMSFWATWSAIVLLLAIEFYRPNFLETYIALGIVMFAACGALFFGRYYYGHVRKKIGF